MSQPPAAPNGAPSKPLIPAPPVRRVAKPPPTLFRKVNNKRPSNPVTRLLPSYDEEPKTNGVKPARAASPSKPPSTGQAVSGFSDPRVVSENIPFKDYKLVTTKRDLLQDLRYHLLHLAYPHSVDIRNDEEFQKPVHLHRRDTRYKSKKSVKEEGDQPRDGLDPETRAEFDRRKEQRRKEREENLAQVAPAIATQKKISSKKRTAQVNRSNLSDEQKRIIQSTYEEKLPWHLEDWNGEKVLVGQHQVGPARMHAALTFDPLTGRYRMIAVEKVYAFQPKKEEVDRGPELTLEELEKALKKKHILPDLLARHEESQIQKRQKKVESERTNRLYTGGGRSIDASRGGEDADMDFDDDFADDEEGDIFGDDDEDKKTAEKKIKEDQLQANFLDFKDTRDYDVLDEREERERTALRRNFKDVRKALAKREGNYNQGSDSDEDYSSTDSEAERERLEAEKQANLKKDEDASRVPSGANTPSSRKEKTGTASDREGKKVRPPKRPGSPNLSDASGTDVSVARKKKKTRHNSSAQPTPGPSRPMSPDNANANLDPSTAARIPRSSSFASQGGATSDTDGGAMSDGTRTKLKLKVGKNNTSPPISRPSSPPPAQIQHTPAFFASLIPPGGIAIKEWMGKAGIHKRDDMKSMLPTIRKAGARIENGRIYLHEKPPGPEAKTEGA